jgi:hypothetical protein
MCHRKERIVHFRKAGACWAAGLLNGRLTMKFVCALVLVLVLGVLAVLPASVQAGPIIYRGGAWDRWVDTGYAFPGAWGYSYSPGYYQYNPNSGYYYYNSGYLTPAYSGYYYTYP